jgi:hypothetical protein
MADTSHLYTAPFKLVAVEGRRLGDEPERAAEVRSLHPLQQLVRNHAEQTPPMLRRHTQRCAHLERMHRGE